MRTVGPRARRTGGWGASSPLAHPVARRDDAPAGAMRNSTVMSVTSSLPALPEPPSPETSLPRLLRQAEDALADDVPQHVRGAAHDRVRRRVAHAARPPSPER